MEQNNNINYSDFNKLDIRLGTIIHAEEYNKLIKPSILLKIDFGSKIGIKKSSAQLRKNYIATKLINKQVIAVVNFQPKQIGKIISEVLVLGLPDNENEPILVSPEKKLANGSRLY
ncbi:tRNA-binding protein [Pelagibacteraceae bacterium]|nr:tRNA-binding protein [Pelagibacteraceae bacterium]